MTDPAWYNTPDKRNIIYFYPGSTPIDPVGRVFEHYLKDLANKPAPNTVPRLNVYPQFTFPAQ